MNIHDIANRRRAVRVFKKEEEIDAEKVKECLEIAQLAPTSSNLQLYETYHITSPELLHELSHACLNQTAATTADEMVVFVARPDLYKAHAKAVLKFEEENIRRNSPKHRIEARQKLMQNYYLRLIPFLYARFLGLIGLLRCFITLILGCFRPIVREVSEKDVDVVVQKSCGIAVGYFMLAMAEIGYDTCPLEGYDSWRVRRILHLPRGAKINMIVCCGIADSRGIRGDRFRLPFDEIYTRK